MKRFSAEGWRVITCSRQPFAENCPWPAGPEDHIQLDLSDPDNLGVAVAEMQKRLEAEGSRLHARRIVRRRGGQAFRIVRQALEEIMSGAPTTRLDRSIRIRVHAISISDFEFDPATLQVKPGDRITWTNSDIAPHTATALDGSWDTGELTRGQSKTLVVTAELATDYFCRFHPSMTARLIVG